MDLVVMGYAVAVPDTGIVHEGDLSWMSPGGMAGGDKVPGRDQGGPARIGKGVLIDGET